MSIINLQPTLIGKLVKIRPITPRDFESLAKAASDPLIWQQHPEPRRSEKEFFRQKFFESALACGGGVVFENGRAEIMGSSRYYNYRAASKDITIGYTFLSREYWGSTYNREIKHLMMGHIYQWVDTILFTVGTHNARSRKAMVNIGGQLLSPEETQRRHLSLEGSVIYEIKKDHFRGLV